MEKEENVNKDEVAKVEALVEMLLLRFARMTLDLRAAVASGVSPNKALELIRGNPAYDAIAVRSAEKVLKMIVEELKQ
jgi:hypothetical protein